MPKKETKEYIAEEDLLYDAPDSDEETKVREEKSSGSLVLIMFLCIFLPIAGFVAGVQYMSQSVVPAKVREGVQPLTNQVSDLEQTNLRLEAELASSQEALLASEKSVEMLRMATSMIDTDWLAPNIYRSQDRIISIEPNRERVIFDNIDVRSFGPVAEFSGDQSLSPIADGGYSVRWFSDENNMYCLERRGVMESVKLSQPVEVQFTVETNNQDFIETDMWFKRTESDEGRDFGYVTFFQPETNQRYDLACQLIESNDNS
jgi:hypothetical protein